jgi:16S rRNA (guanine527-N7)-methyltransferase
MMNAPSPSPLPLSAGSTRELLHSFQLPVTHEFCESVRDYVELLLRWNQRISLTSIESPEDIVTAHFAESLLGTKALPGLRGRLADVGTGGGFPGVPLRMFLPDLTLTLIESNAKRCAFLAEVTRTLGLRGVEILQRRYEDVARVDPGFDVIAARALGQFGEFLEWAETTLADGGHMIVWTGPDGKSELERRKGWKWREPYAIPRTKRRLILVGSR